MRGTIARIALLAWVGGLLLAPVVGYALGFRGHDIENRTLARGPSLSVHAFLHTSAWHQAALAFSDHMPLRDRAIHWKAETQFRLFDDSPRPDLVLVGRGGWLFLHEEFTTCELYPTTQPLAIAQAFGLAHAAARSSGRALYTMLIPAKATIEADHYRTSEYSFEACPRARERTLEQLMARQPGDIDLWSALRAAKEHGDVWIPNDSHTDTAGSIAIAKALVTAIRPSAWQDGLEQVGAPISATGDLDVLAGITDTATRHALVLHGTPRHPVRAHVLEFVDSQLEESDPEVAPYLPNRQLLGLDGLLFGQVPRSVIRAAHVIVVESVQRTTYERVVNFSFPLPLLDAFVPDIPRLPAAYGVPSGAMGARLTLPPGVVNVPVTVAHDNPRVWRLLIYTVLAEGAPVNTALLDAGLAPRTTIDSARGALPVGAVVPLAIPPGVALRNVRLSIDAPAGATLSPLQFAPLSGS